MREIRYIPVYKGKKYKPVTWDEMIRLRASLLNLKWRVVYVKRAG